METKQGCPRVTSRIVALAGLFYLTIAGTSAYGQWNAWNLDAPDDAVEESVALSGVGTQAVGRAYVIGWTSNAWHAALWTFGDTVTFIDLNPAGATSSDSFAMTATQQVGSATFGNATHAGLWSGTAASWVDLNPAGATSSMVAGVGGAQQVGAATYSNGTHAGRWNGTAASWVDLNPAGATGSLAYAIVPGAPGRQVGSATFGSATHAGLWNGTAASWVDLHPSGATSSVAKFITGTQQVGSATFGSATHAGLWSGTAVSWVDLNPAGATGSQVNGISSGGPGQQVGQATLGSATHAGFWSGTAASWVDLNPAGAVESAAFAISGNIQVGYAKLSGGAYQAGSWSGTAASWQPFPYPPDDITWSQWYPAQGKSVWTDGGRLFVAGYVSRWQYVSTVHHDNAVLWWQPYCTLPGDMNLDGLRDGADIQAFLNCRLGASVNCSCADQDGNGIVNSADVAALVSALLS